MTPLEIALIAFGLGLLIGIWIARRDYRAQIKDLEAWNFTALAHLCESEDEKGRH